MSLAKLLSTGKSLVGGAKDNSARYRMGSPGLLPKFGSAVKPAPAQSEQKSAAQVDEEREVMKCAAESEQPKPVREPMKKGISVGKIYRSWLGLIKRRLGRASVKPNRGQVSKTTRTPVQVELSLDNVRVVRNDLSDSDLEIVPARKESCGDAATTIGLKSAAAEKSSDSVTGEELVAGNVGARK